MNVPDGRLLAGGHTVPKAAWLMVAARTRRRTGRLFRPLPAKE